MSLRKYCEGEEILDTLDFDWFCVMSNQVKNVKNVWKICGENGSSHCPISTAVKGEWRFLSFRNSDLILHAKIRRRPNVELFDEPNSNLSQRPPPVSNRDHFLDLTVNDSELFLTSWTWPLDETRSRKRSPVVRPPPVSEHSVFAFWAVAYGKFYCIQIVFNQEPMTRSLYFPYKPLESTISPRVDL